MFHSVCTTLMNPDFWKWVFVMCCAFDAPMQVLCLADQKSLVMDKLNYYVMQTNQMLPKYISDAEEHAGTLLMDSTLRMMDSQTSPAGLSDDEEDASENNSVEDINEDIDGDAELVNSDDNSDNKLQVLILLTLYFFLIHS